MFCTEKERKTCNVEKMGCKGCYYNNEDIEILEMDLDDIVEYLIKQVSFEYGQIIGRAIKNMINRNKELEEYNMKYIVQLTDEQYRNLVDIIRKEVNNEWKSKVKEKIEELEKDVKDFEEYWSTDPRRFKRQKSIDYYKLEALQELLEE